MNTLEHRLRDSHEDLIMDGPQISRGAPRTPRTAPTHFARRRHWAFLGLVLVISLGGIAVFVHLLGSAFGDPSLTLQEFEGLGIVLGVLAYMGIFLWRVSRALEEESQQAEAWENSSEVPPVVARELNTGK